MEQFATEEQQVEAIKRFWKENGMVIILGAVIGLGGLWGWRYYSDSQIAAKEAASEQYQQVITSLQQSDGMAKAESFVAQYPNSGYAAVTGLVLGQQAVEKGDLDTAATHLAASAEHSDQAIASVAKIRLARVQLAQNNAQQALSTLEQGVAEAFTAQLQEVKGDAYLQLGDFDNARLAYSQAVESDANNRIVKMKLDNLAVASGS